MLRVRGRRPRADILQTHLTSSGKLPVTPAKRMQFLSGTQVFDLVRANGTAHCSSVCLPANLDVFNHSEGGIFPRLLEIEKEKKNVLLQPRN